MRMRSVDTRAPVTVHVPWFRAFVTISQDMVEVKKVDVHKAYRINARVRA